MIAQTEPRHPLLPLTIEQIISAALKLDPHKAIGLHDGSAVAACTSLVYTQIIDRKGETVSLRHFKYHDPHDEEVRACSADDPDARYAAIYVRVSTPMQADDGWSTRDQCERAIAYCLDKGWAFRIFNDQGLSGRLPMRESHAISRMYQRRADLYAYYFTKVFLDAKLSPRFTPLQKEMLARYRDERVGEYMKRRGESGETAGIGVESGSGTTGDFRPGNETPRSASQILRQETDGLSARTDIPAASAAFRSRARDYGADAGLPIRRAVSGDCRANYPASRYGSRHDSGVGLVSSAGQRRQSDARRFLRDCRKSTF